MSTICKIIPVTPGAVGAPESVSDLAAEKTFVIKGVVGSLQIEAGIAGKFCPVRTVGSSDNDFVFTVVCEELRVDASNGSGEVSVAAERAESRFVTCPGDGTPVDVTLLGSINTALMDDADAVNVALEISQDYDPLNPGAATWAQVMKSFTKNQKCDTAIFQACYARSVAQGDSAEADIALGAQEDALAAISEPRSGIYFHPGGVEGGNVYTTWEGAYGAVQALIASGQEVDLHFISADSPDIGLSGQPSCLIPAGDWDMYQVHWVSSPNQNVGDFRVFVQFEDGAIVHGLEELTGEAWELVNNSLVNSPLVDINVFTCSGLWVRFRQYLAGAAPFFNNNLGFLFWYTLSARCEFRSSNTTPTPPDGIVDIAGGSMTMLDVGGGSLYRDGTIFDSVGGGDFDFQTTAQTTVSGSNNFNFPTIGTLFGDLGTSYPYLQSRFNGPVAVGDSPFDGKTGGPFIVCPVDTSGGAVSLCPPRSVGPQGRQFIVKDIAGNIGTAAVTIDLTIGGGTDTFEDGSTSWVIGGGGAADDYMSAKLISDGYGTWYRIGVSRLA